jgi:CPA1 family monovalent cation:H+ antiporter
VALFLHNRLRWSAPLARIIEERFEVLLSQSVIFGDLEGFINARIKRLHGRRVAGLLQELLSRRKTMVETALEGLRLQFPGYAEELGRNIIQRTALRLEEREYDSLREQSLVGEELYITLVQDIASRREIAEHRLSIDLSVQRAELIKQYPLFTDLDEASLKRLARNLQSRYVGADTVIINKDSVMKKVYFIASGAVEIESAGRLSRLGRGEIFGVMTLLSGKHRRIKARTIVPSTLLVLDETKFRRLLERSPKLQQIVNDTSNVH